MCIHIHVYMYIHTHIRIYLLLWEVERERGCNASSTCNITAAIGVLAGFFKHVIIVISDIIIFNHIIQ